MKINWFFSEKYFCTDESVKRQITDSTSENSTDSDLESNENVFLNTDKASSKLDFLFSFEIKNNIIKLTWASVSNYKK